MLISKKPRRYIDDASNAVIRVEPDNSRYDLVEIKQRPDDIELRVRSAGSGHVDSYIFEFLDEAYRAVENADNSRRRDIDDDLQDILHTAGFTLVDTSLERW